MKPNRILSAALLAGLACGLSGLNLSCKQDPMASQPEAIRKGVPPEKPTPSQAAKPVAEDALRIDANDFYNFHVGQQSDFVISGRILMPIDGHDAVLGQDYQVDVENLADFKGASFDPATGKFTWTPDKLLDDSQYQETRTLTLEIYTTAAPVLKRTRSINLFVSRAEAVPLIVSIDDLTLPPLIHEGDTRKFNVVVQDPDSLDADGMRPSVFPIRATDTGDISHLVTMVPSSWNTKNPTQDPTDPTKWTFAMQLSLRNQEVTHQKDTLNFALEVVNRYGHTAQQTAKATIATSLRDPVSSWQSSTPITVVAGEENVVNFTVYDPQGEGTVVFNWGDANWLCGMLPGSASCTCVAQDYTNSSQVCTLRWKIPVDVKAQDFRISGDIVNQTKVPGDNLRVDIPFSRRLTVVPASAAPAPSSTPIAGSAPVPGPSPVLSPTPHPHP